MSLYTKQFQETSAWIAPPLPISMRVQLALPGCSEICFKPTQILPENIKLQERILTGYPYLSSASDPTPMYF